MSTPTEEPKIVTARALLERRKRKSTKDDGGDEAPLEMTQRSEGDITTQEMVTESTSSGDDKDYVDGEDDDAEGEEEEAEAEWAPPPRKKTKDTVAINDYFDAFPQGPKEPYGLPPLLGAEDIFMSKPRFRDLCPSYTPLSSGSLHMHVQHVPQEMHMIFLGYDDVAPGRQHVRVSRGAMKRQEWPVLMTPVVKASGETAAAISALGNYAYIQEMQATNPTYQPSEYAPASYEKSQAEFVVATEYNPAEDAKRHLVEIPYGDFFGENPKGYPSAWARPEVARFFWEIRNTELRGLRRVCVDRTNFLDALFEEENNKVDAGYWIKAYRAALDKKADSKVLEKILMDMWRGSSSSIYSTHPPQIDAAGRQKKDEPCQTRLKFCASTSLFAKFKPSKTSVAYQERRSKNGKPIGAGLALSTTLHYPEVAEADEDAPFPEELVRVMDAATDDQKKSIVNPKVNTYVGTVVSALRKFKKPGTQDCGGYRFALDTVPVHLRKFEPGTQACAKFALRLNLMNGSGTGKKKKICTIAAVLREVVIFEAASPNKGSLATAGDVDEF